MDFQEEKNSPVPRVAAIHDLSGFGRSSLTIVIPTLSTMGIQVCPLPTAVLSSQTAGVSDFTFFDLTSQMGEMLDHWKRLNLSFDAVYSGFLGSADQVALVERCMREHITPKGIFLVDPVLGDDGELYPTQTQEIVTGMRNLVGLADIITPNFTEACLLLGEKYTENVNSTLLKEYLLRLSEIEPENSVSKDSLQEEKESSPVPPTLTETSPQTLAETTPQALTEVLTKASPQTLTKILPKAPKKASPEVSPKVSPKISTKTVIITSAPCEDDNFIRVVAYEAATQKFWQVKSPKIHVSYPGTGDTFASVFLGALLQKDSVPMAMARATRFVYEAIMVSYGYNIPVSEGIMLERVLSSLEKNGFCEYEIF